MKSKEDLLRLKTEIDDRKTKIAELKGSLKFQMNQLKEQHQCTSVEAAIQKIAELDKELVKISNQIEDGTKALEIAYNLTNQE
jgi:uncharacterized beta-barrel protein YwiB (DUF1934 family)